MDTSIISVLNMSAYVIYFMLPAYIANAAALTFGGGKPLDFSRKFSDGRRIFGDGVTWRGTIIGAGIGTLIGLIQGLISGNILQGILLGFCLGAGALIGDACGSFVKRRLKIERGRPTPFLDQLDFVIGALVFASIVVILPFYMIILTFIISIILHLSANIISYLLGMKEVWY
ncbi:MAG: CDP-2,3-bis-(O-geranylgeranyl)-sn-glycerol synthase [Methanobacterium sp.]|uniref:CDP-2,3-bis-(O-geranylgeranyl)-sn-glycerol synthase n=1 Tax=Methanobacterium sp. TaxID=2164 RepID=UPI003D659410|nr:CDP-2,3-bis-(O-geranylgeranyl)-sn-glycerol synthase [Methanobacterium sp.]